MIPIDAADILLGTSVLVGIIGMLGFGMQVWALYLNHKQASIKHNGEIMIELLREIRDAIKGKK